MNFKFNTNKKTIMKTALISVLTLAILISTAYALFSDHKTADNMFTVGNIRMELRETKWVNENSSRVDSNRVESDGSAVYKTPPMLPGEYITKDPLIANTGKNPAYVFMSIKIPYDGSNPLFSYSIDSSKWELKREKTLTSEKCHEFVYEYKQVLNPEEQTPVIFDGEQVRLIDNNNINYSAYSDVEVVCKGIAIQTTYENENLTLESAWNVVSNMI